LEWLSLEQLGEAVRALGQIIRQRLRHFTRVGHIDYVSGDETAEIVRVNAPSQVVPSRDGTERTCIVRESCRVLDPRSLGRRAAITGRVRAIPLTVPV